MANELHIITGTKEEQYENLLQQLQGILYKEDDLIAALSNTCAAIKQQFNWLWVGFYMVKNNTLVLGPFQGPIACTRIGYGKGVCGHAWEKKEPVVVDNVHLFAGHIACSSASVSEVVIPILKDNVVVAVLDIDSIEMGNFDTVDVSYLQKIIALLPF